MADVNANIGVSIDTSEALAQLKSLQRQISQFHTSIAKSSESAALAQRSLQKNLIGSINSLGAFSAELRTVRTTAETFTNSLEKNKFSMREYFRYAGASTKTFGRLFKSEFDTIGKVAEERVKTLQTQYIKLGRNASGAMEAIAIRPTSLNMQDLGTKTALAAQKQALFNQLMKQGSTNLLNFGKNTQWAGRQLMVGFTIPLSIVGSTATKTFMDMEAQALKFKKVYGDLFTPKAETQAALDNVVELGRQFTKYGVAVSDTVGLAAEAAAAGFQGLDLERQTVQATRLSVLGQIDRQKALETTISLQNAFGMSSEKLADSINFLNAVENQTVVSLDDITTAIPKVAPVIEQLGGDVKDLTFFMAAMKEGGINASEGANALKSGLAALINPTRKASEMLASYGINATAIIEKNKGNLKATVIEFANALNRLDPLARARAIEQMFGKFQFARLSTLFANVAKDGNQAARVLDLANASVEELSALSEQELGMTADSAMNKFKKSVEDLKLSLVPVGKAFLEAATPIIEFVGGVLEKFGNLSAGTKKLITILTVSVGAIGPIFLMTFGLLANLFANALKGAMILRQGYLRLTGQSQILGEQTQYLNTEQLEAAAAAHSLDQAHATLTQRFTVETAELNKLVAAYQSATRASQNFALSNPGAMIPIRGRKKFASGGVVPGSGNKDTVPAMLTPGEVVVPKGVAKNNMDLLSSLLSGRVARRYAEGTLNVGGGRQVRMNIGAGALPEIQKVINNVLAAGNGLSDAEGMLAETLSRLAKDTRVTIKSFKAELDTVITSIQGSQLSEKIIGERKYSASKAGVGQDIPTQLTSQRPQTAQEELARANAAQKAVVEELTRQGKTQAQIKNASQLSRAHVIEVTNAQKMYAEAWDSNLFVVQTQAENQLSSSLMSAKNQKPYLKSLNEIDASEQVKLSIQNKITKNLALNEKELQVQAQVLKRMLADTAAMSKTSAEFGSLSRATIAAAGARSSLGPASAGVGSREAAQIEMSRQALLRTQFRGQTSFTKNLRSSGSKAMEELMLSMENKAQTKSPSKRTAKLGKDIMAGLVVGMQQGEKAVNAQAQKAADIATLSKTSLYGTTGGIDPVQKSIRRQLDKRAKISGIQEGMAVGPGIMERVRQSGASRSGIMGRVRNINPMKAGMGLMGLGMAGSMLPGTAGNVAGKVTGAAFVAQTLMMLPGPLKLVAVAFGGLYGITKLLNAAKEKERQAIEGVGKAANLSASQIEKLGGVLGFTPVKSNLELSKPAVSGLTVEKSQQVEQTRKLLAEDPEFKNQINALKNTTNEQADIIFKSLALRLTGQGATKEQITNYIYALQQEAGKTDVKFDLKSIDLSTKEGQAGLQNSVNTLLKDYKTAFDKGYKTTKVQSRTTGDIIEIGIASDELKTKLSTTANVISNTFMSLDTQLRGGKISADQFNQSFDNISNSINEMPKAEGLFLMGELLKILPSELAKSASGLKNTSDQLLIIKSAALGVAVTAEMIQALTIADTDKSADAQIRAAAIRGDLENAMKKAQKVIAEIIKQNKIATSGAKGTDTREIASKRLSVISNFFNAQEALLRQNRQSKADALQAEIDLAETAVKSAEDRIDAEQKLVDINQRSIDLLNRKIELEYDRPIQRLQDESTILNNNLDIIRRQEDAINSQYDKQIDSLEKISSINQEISNQEKSRLSIVDAITSGDISAAAAAVQDARAQAAASRLEQQRNALETSRQQALAGVTAGGMTKDQIESRTYQIGQQTFLLEQQRKVVQGQITALQDKNYTLEQGIYSIKQNSLIPAQQNVDKAKAALEEYNKQTDSLVNSITYLGKTQTEWNNVKTRVEAANAAIDLTELGLRKASTLTSQIFKDWDAIKSKTITITTNYVSGPIGGASDYLNPKTQTSTYRAKMYGGKIKGMNMGGIVPKYMGNGGKIGSDTVPTMLTPGEFVINKRAAKEFGPLLSMLNESKYPSMLIDNNGMNDFNKARYNVSKLPQFNPTFQKIQPSVTNNSMSPVYNYSVNMSVNGDNVDPNAIANTVIGKLKQLENRTIRRQGL
jgi:TP901 family phage tail tape measure protein